MHEAKGTSRAPHRSRKLADIIAHDLVAEIAKHGLGAGRVLPAEADMVRSFGVGRATVREALRLLEVQGLIMMRPGPGGGPTVAHLGAPDFARVATLYLQVAGATKGEIIAARIELEASMARLAAEAQDPAGLAQLRAELDEADALALHDDDVFQRLSSSFHMTVAGISGNRVLDLLGRSLKAVYDLYLPAYLLPLAEREQVRRIHAAIGQAILEGRGGEAEQLMRDHLTVSRARTAQHRPELLKECVAWA
jgi:GntR family transcriptional repressor for pyruvate dehydrogenase complex